MSKRRILEADDLPLENVDVPEWGCEVWVRTLTGKERDAFERQFVTVGGKGKALPENVRARLAVVALCDEQGKRLFEDGDVEALGAKSCAPLDRVFGVAMRLNGLTDEDVEDLAKNSERPQNDGSGSG